MSAPAPGTRCDVYFNLRTGLWSIRVKGRVVAHSPTVTIADARGVVSEAGRQRVLRLQQRSVHAVIRGTFVSLDADTDGRRAVSYNPYSGPTFYHCDDRSPWCASPTVTFAASTAWV